MGKALTIDNSSGFHLDTDGPPEVCGVEFADSAGVRGPSGSGGIVSASAFNDWYRDVMGVNLSANYAIELVSNGSGLYEFHSDAFHPIDNQLYGNEGEAHNNYFTFVVQTRFTFKACSGQYVEFQGADDAWMFVNKNLAIDLGGVVPNTPQRVDMDRLGLADGVSYALHLFYAQRNSSVASFHVATNIEFDSQDLIYTMSAGVD
jgi:fibro-slime domain-containing protein